MPSKKAPAPASVRPDVIDPSVTMAFSVYSNRGAYALLLGSGISRPSGIPTGWEVVVDLIRKVAKLEKADCEPDPAAWWKSKHGSPADYRKLLDIVAKTATERQALLRAYFEADEQEHKEGLKAPTAAHHAIARLAAGGYVRVLITTNFDRLIEKALEQAGIVPTVISTADQLAGALPLTHSGVTLIKLHGDYLDTRIKNTEPELTQYDPAVDVLLDRIFDDYGLIVCGWSADWDIALLKAVERCPTRRFTTFWATRSELKGNAQRLAHHRQAVVVKIEDANQFFTGLSEKVQALEDLAAPHPLSAKMAIATVKRYIVDPGSRIKLHDLVRDETERAYAELGPENFPLDRQPTIEEFAKRAGRYEAIAESLLGIVTTGCFWDDPERSELWAKALERIGNQPTPQGNYIPDLDEMRQYPALLLAYGGGIAALAARKYETFRTLLTLPRDFGRESLGPLITRFSPRSVSFVVDEHGKKVTVPLHKHLYPLFKEHFRKVIPEENDFRSVFDRFEYFFGLLLLQFSNGQMFWPGGYWSRSRYDLENSIMTVVHREATAAASGQTCAYLKAGLFEGSATKLLELQKKLHERLGYVSRW